MKILTIDVGAGTQDIMLYDTSEPIENSVKLVMPSPTRIFAERIRKHRNDLFIKGETMGGGPINTAIKNHLDKGYRVIMTENAARTVRDDLNRVKAMGIEVVPEGEKHPEIAKMEFKDIDLEAIGSALSNFDVELEFDYIGVAVQDHGYMEGVGDRNFRFMKIREKLDVPRGPEEFAYFNEAPEYFTRMNAVFRTLKGYKTTVMDSKFASICGATCDEQVESMEKFIVMDVGNGHTLAAAFDGEKMFGVFEHHTSALTPEKLDYLLKKLADGTLTHEEVHADGGHGALINDAIGDFECVVATGPRRKILQNADFKVHYAAPAGDVMMTGSAGLIKTILSKQV